MKKCICISNDDELYHYLQLTTGKTYKYSINGLSYLIVSDYELVTRMNIDEFNKVFVDKVELRKNKLNRILK